MLCYSEFSIQNFSGMIISYLILSIRKLLEAGMPREMECYAIHFLVVDEDIPVPHILRPQWSFYPPSSYRDALSACLLARA